MSEVFAVPGTILAGYGYLKSRSVPLSHFRIWAIGAVLIIVASIIPIPFVLDFSLEYLGTIALCLGIDCAAIGLNYHLVREGKSG